LSISYSFNFVRHNIMRVLGCYNETEENMVSPNHLIDSLMETACESCKGITFVTSERQDKHITYRELVSQILYTLFHLQSRGMRPKDELVLQLDDNCDFILGFWAGICGGFRPVPLAVGFDNERQQKLWRVWEKLDNPFLLTNSVIFDRIINYVGKNHQNAWVEQIKRRTLLIDQVENIRLGSIQKGNEQDIAFIQFSSGSTGYPKGVVLTHQNLLTNIRAIIRSAQMTSDDIMLSWMPLTHDMGLIGLHLMPLVDMADQFLMPTSLFVRRLRYWPRLILAINI
jgi:acyl-CoA synthetase (AMP-forming)/AMP-acid ligase II